MDIREAVNTMLKDMGQTQGWLATRRGYKGPSSVSQPLSRGNIEIGLLLRICEMTGYELVLQKKKTAGKRQAGQLVVDKARPDRDRSVRSSKTESDE